MAKIERTQVKKRRLPYFTEEELDAEVPAVVIKVFGDFNRRGEGRGVVFKDGFEAEIVVPKNYNLGHVKLMTNRFVRDPRNKLGGTRARQIFVDTDFSPVPVTDKKYKMRDFLADTTIVENNINRDRYLEKMKKQEEDDGEIDMSKPSVESRWSKEEFYSR